MSVTTTRTSNNLTIIDAQRWPDGKVVITFMVHKVGIYYNVRAFTKAFTRKLPNGFLMTPAIGDLRHSPDPLFVVAQGQVFRYVWDAPADGYGTGSIYGITFQLGYVDFLCCDEVEGGYEQPGGAVPPGIRTTPGTTPAVPVAAPAPGVPPMPAPNPGQPNSQPPIAPEPNAGLTDPEVPAQAPYVPSWFRHTYGRQETVAGQPAGSTPSVPPQLFPYLRQTHTTRPAPVPAAVGVPQPVVPTAQPVVTQGTVQGTQTQGLETYRPLPPYRVAQDLQGLFGMESVRGGLQVRGFVPTPPISSARSNLYYAVENTNPAGMSGIHAAVLALDSSGVVRVVQEASQIQATSAQQSHQPPGYVPPGVSAGEVVCIDWPQFSSPNVTFLVVLLNQQLQPIVAATVPGFWVQPGALPPAATQTVDDLGPGIRDVAGFPFGLEPKYEGSVNSVGYEDTYVFTARRQQVAIVVKISADAAQLGFDPVMHIYDVDNMSTPIVVHSSRFQAGDTDIEPEAHAIGFKDVSGLLQVGHKYAIVVKHSAPFYSKRWTFRIYHVEDVVQTGGSLSIDGNGKLAGSLSCSYGRQAVKIFNPRTDEAIFVLTNERGATENLQRDTTEGTNGRRLSVSYGDVLEIIRPGPSVQYRRHGDLIGEATL